MRIPSLLTFERKEGPHLSSKWTWKRRGFRPPLKGEYYVSGAEPMAYKAHSDLTGSYLIVEAIEEYRQRTEWLPVSLPKQEL